MCAPSQIALSEAQVQPRRQAGFIILINKEGIVQPSRRGRLPSWTKWEGDGSLVLFHVCIGLEFSLSLSLSLCCFFFKDSEGVSLVLGPRIHIKGQVMSDVSHHVGQDENL